MDNLENREAVQPEEEAVEQEIAFTETEVIEDDVEMMDQEDGDDVEFSNE